MPISLVALLGAVGAIFAAGVQTQGQAAPSIACGNRAIASGTAVKVSLFVRSTPHGDLGYFEDCPNLWFGIHYAIELASDDRNNSYFAEIIRRSLNGGPDLLVHAVADIDIRAGNRRYPGVIKLVAIDRW
jgi:hypothetical protein